MEKALYTLSISDWISRLSNEGWEEEFGNKITQDHVEALRSIFRFIRDNHLSRARFFYSDCVPQLNLDSNPWGRKVVGQVLYFVWCECQEKMLPEFNFLVVGKADSFPGKGVRSTWMETYGSGVGYEEYCNIRADECLRFLSLGWVEIVE